MTPIQSENSTINNIFTGCVNLLLYVGGLLGLSYNTINVLVFCVIWPVITAGLMAACGWLWFTRQKTTLAKKHDATTNNT
jgi:hypothetical protein